jgi:DNA phosphorothioation-dependent restriction protein DptG
MKPEREELLRLMAELSEMYPSMRFGQLVTNVAYWAKGPTASAAWDAADQEMIEAARNNLQRNKGQRFD